MKKTNAVATEQCQVNEVYVVDELEIKTNISRLKELLQKEQELEHLKAKITVEGIDRLIRETAKPTLQTSLNGSEVLHCNFTEVAQAIVTYLQESEVINRKET